MWYFNLPIVLLVLRTTMKENFPLSPAELVHGQDLRLLGEFKIQNMPSVLQRQNLVQHLKDFISDLKPVPPRVHSEVSTYLDKQLQHCKMVLIQNDAVEPTLATRFSGPFEIIKRCDKYFALKDPNNGSEKSQYLSIDLKSSIQPLNHHLMKQSPSNLPLKKRLLQPMMMMIQHLNEQQNLPIRFVPGMAG